MCYFQVNTVNGGNECVLRLCSCRREEDSLTYIGLRHEQEQTNVVLNQ